MDAPAQVRSRIAQIQAQLPGPTRPAPAAAADWASAAARAGLTAKAASASATPASPSDTGGIAAVKQVGSATPAEVAAVAKAREHLGVPYLWGDMDPSKGLDCSGFTQLVYKSQGVDLPRISAQQATAGRPVGSLAEARPGDLLFFDYSPSRPGIDHVGAYLGDGEMMAAPQPGDVVKIQPAGRPTVIRRVLPDGAG